MTIEKLTIDSSVFISLLVQNQRNSKESKLFFDFALNEKIKFLVPIIVLFETFHSLKKLNYFDDVYSYKKYKQLFSFDCFKYFELNFHFFNLFKQLNFFDRLKTSDAIVATSAFLSKSSLITWDSKLLNHSHSAFTPKDFLEQFSP